MAGPDDHTKDILLAKTGLSLGSFPFKISWFAIVSQEIEQAGMSPID